MSFQVQSFANLSLDTLYHHVKNIEGGISLHLCEIFFTFTETLTYLMLHSLAGLSPVAKIDNFPKSSRGGYQHIIFWEITVFQNVVTFLYLILKVC